MYEPRVTGPVRVALVGATGLVGREVIVTASRGDEVRLLGSSMTTMHVRG